MKKYLELDLKPTYVPISADILQKLWQCHSNALVDYEGYKALECALIDTERGRQSLLLCASSPVVLLNIQVVRDIIKEHKRSSVCDEGMNYIGWILEQYEAKPYLVIPEEPNEAFNNAYLEGKILPAYVGAEKTALENFHKSFNLVVSVAKKAISKPLL